MKKENKILTFLASFLIVFLVAFIGSLFTSQNVNTEWYQNIKPSITPPNYVFPIVWTFLFILIAFSLYFAWINAKKEQKQRIAIFFALNFVFNILWSAIYFGMQNPAFAFVEIIFLWLSIIMLIFITYKTSKTAAYLLVPYFLWVSFAIILNYLSL